MTLRHSDFGRRFLFVHWDSKGAFRGQKTRSQFHRQEAGQGRCRRQVQDRRGQEGRV